MAEKTGTRVKRKPKKASSIPEGVVRKKVKKTISELFPEFEDFDQRLTCWNIPNEYVPKVDKHYYFPPETLTVLYALMFNERCLIVGHAGTGKTSLITQILARLNWEAFRVNFDGEIARSTLLGEWIVKGREMEFNYGIIPRACMRDAVLILDEYDMMPPTISGSLQWLLEEEGKLMLMDNGAELITPHRLFRIVCTGNTVGRGDDTGLYTAGRYMQNFAQVDRFTTVVKLDYMPPDREVELIKKKVDDDELGGLEIESFVKVATDVRDAFKNNEIEVTMSTRTLLSWVKKFTISGDREMSLASAFLNKLNDSDAHVITELTRRVFPSTRPTR